MALLNTNLALYLIIGAALLVGGAALHGFARVLWEIR
jgi:hypothetical protein